MAGGNAAFVLRNSIRKASDRYELRMDFENGLYSVAHADKDSLDLDFLTGKFLAEQDANAGAKALTDLVTWTRPDPAYYRASNGDLVQAGVDVPREGHHPAPRILSVPFVEDWSSYADTAAMLAAYDGSQNTADITLNADDTVTLDGVSGSEVRLHKLVATDLEIGAKYLLVFDIVQNQSRPGAGSAFSTFDYFTLSESSTTGERPFYFTATGTDLWVTLSVKGNKQTIYGRWHLAKVSHADGEDAGLLIEPASENVIPHSGDLTQWAQTGCTVALDGGSHPFPKVWSITESALDEQHFITAPGGSIWTVGQQNVGSFAFKPMGRTKVEIIATAGNAAFQTMVEINTGELIGQGVNTSQWENGTFEGRVYHWGDGWYVCEVNAKMNSLNAGVRFALVKDRTSVTHPFPGGTAEQYLGDGTSGILIATPQLEIGKTRATSFIETGATAVTRGADDYDLDTNAVNFCWNPNDMTVVLDITPLGLHAGACRPLEFIAGGTTTSFYHRLIYLGHFEVANSRVDNYPASANYKPFDPAFIGARYRAAGAVNNSTGRLSVNGSAPASDPVASQGATVTSAGLGPNCPPFILHEIKLLPSGRGSDAELQAEVAA